MTVVKKQILYTMCVVSPDESADTEHDKQTMWRKLYLSTYLTAFTSRKATLERNVGHFQSAKRNNHS